MATFSFPNHLTETQYPDSSVQVQMGKAYIFTAPPSAPDQRIFKLHFNAMVFYVDESNIADETIDPENNAKALMLFYEEHKLYKEFVYNHPVFGALNVMFHRPLTMPKPQHGGYGVVRDITIELVEQP